MQNRKNVTCLSVSIYISKLNLKQDNGTFEKGKGGGDSFSIRGTSSRNILQYLSYYIFRLW